MAEVIRVPEYEGASYPFSLIFNELTELAKDMSPVEAYLRYDSLRRANGLHPGPDYCSTAITSSGHARNPNLPISDVITKNTETGQRLLVELTQKGIVDGRKAILPVDLGYVPNWKQTDYMSLWLMVIGGFNLGANNHNRAAGNFETTLEYCFDKHEVDVDVMNDRNLSPQTRAPEYFRFAGAFAEAFRIAVSTAREEAHPAHRILNFVDPAESLGAATERAFGHAIGVEAFSVVSSGPAESPNDTITSPTLARDLSEIVGFGGATIQLLPGNMLGLVRVPADRVLA